MVDIFDFLNITITFGWILSLFWSYKHSSLVFCIQALQRTRAANNSKNTKKYKKHNFKCSKVFLQLVESDDVTHLVWRVGIRPQLFNDTPMPPIVWVTITFNRNCTDYFSLALEQPGFEPRISGFEFDCSTIELIRRNSTRFFLPLIKYGIFYIQILDLHVVKPSS